MTPQSGTRISCILPSFDVKPLLSLPCSHSNGNVPIWNAKNPLLERRPLPLLIRSFAGRRPETDPRQPLQHVHRHSCTGRSSCARAITLLLRRRPHPQCLSDPDTRDEAQSMHPVSCNSSVCMHPGQVTVLLIHTIRYRRSECELIAKGYFSQDVPSLRLMTNITSDIAGEPSVILLIKDDFCAWAHVVQGRASSCPPKKGTAVVKFTTLLMQGWIPEVSQRESKGDAQVSIHFVCDI